MIKKITLCATLCLLCLCAALTAQAQTDVSEACQKMEQQVASGELSDDEMFQSYNDLIWDYYSIDFDKTYSYFQEAYAFAREKKNVEKEASFLTSMGDIFRIYQVKDSVLIYLDKAWNLLEGKGYYNEEFWNYTARGDFYDLLCDYEKALESFLKGLEATEKDRAQLTAQKKSIERTLRNEVRLLSNISNIYSSLFNVDKSIEYLLRAVKIMENNPDVHFKEKYATLGNLGDRYLYIGDLEKALPLLEESYQLAADNEDLRLMVYGLLRLAAYNKRIANLMQAIDYEKQALQIAEQINQPVLLNEVDKGLMQSYTPIEEYKLSIYHGERVLERTDEEEWKSLEIVYRNMALNYAALGDIEKAYDYMHKYQLSFLKIADETMHSALQEMEVKYDVQQKELQISNQQLEIKQHQTRQYLFISGLILAGLLVTMLVIIVMMRTRRNHILVEMNAIKDKFFSIISHDLKNPVFAQRTALQTLIDYGDQWDADKLQNAYGELLHSANGLSELLKNLLGWAQIQTGRVMYNPVLFNLVAALEPDINLIKNMAESKDISFEAKIPETAFLTADENMMITIIRNLLANAVKFTSAGGTVTFEITPLTSHLTPQTSYRISVSDTGAGMSAVETQCIASLQTRSKPGTAGESGTGLGLIVCKEMIEKHGSKMNVESEEGKGSRFWFTM